MNKDNNILQFEADDASRTGINGKQVFFTKRINGKVTRNKEVEYDSRHISENKVNKSENDDELFIEFKNIKIKPEQNSQNNTPINKNNERNQKINKRKNTKSLKVKIISKIIIIVFLLIGTGIFALVSPIFSIKEIKVIGNDKVDSSTIISLSGVVTGKNIFQISKNKIISGIKENPYINSVNIKRSLPGTLELNIEERKVAYQIKVINSYIFIDYQGYILETSSKSAKVPLIEGFNTEQDILLNGKRLSNEDIELLRSILRIMETAKASKIDKLISKIKSSNNEYILELEKENKIVYLGNGTDLTSRMEYVKMIIDHEKGKSGKIFVNGDINNGFKPYFREEKN